jgi:tetratricopeptide (TPR) repeat protein
MRVRIVLASFGLVVTAHAALADSLADCSQGRNADLRLRACSAIIASTAATLEDKGLAYRNRGTARVDAGANEQAMADFDQAIALRPGDTANYAGRARAKLGLRDLPGSTADYSEAIRLAPGNASLYLGRGHVRFVQGDQAGAIADFTEAIRLNPNSASAFNRRGLAHRRAGELPQAIEDYTAAIAINPIYALAYNNRGYAYEAQGRKEDAIADFQAALLLDPSLIGARDGLVRLRIPSSWLAQTESRVEEGKALVEQNCKGCHAVGSQGVSPNKKAPEFRTLHERHPSIALREPLSRGIAAPHDEMPKFALSGPQIEAIVAYINSLSGAVPAKAPKVVLIADGQDVGDARKGLAYAQRVCAECHNVLRSEATSPNRQAPPFKKVADTPGMSVTALTVWSRTSHPTMPNFVIEPADMDDLIAYILSLREKK